MVVHNDFLLFVVVFQLNSLLAPEFEGRHFVVKAQHMLLKHVFLVKGLVAKMALVFARSWGVILVVFEVDVKLVFLHEQLSASANLKYQR